jgi:DNA-binding SARP family transcriptional activator/TolB-like protein
MSPPSHAAAADISPGASAPDDDSARFDVRLFGAFRLTAPDGSAATPSGRKARVVLACLLLSDGAPVSRDRLMGLLWADRGDDQARASLRQTLYEMRALGAAEAPLLLQERATAAVDPRRVTSDLDRMRRLAAASDADALVEVLSGQSRDLLADLDGIAPEADQWLAGERLRRGDERRRIVLDAAAAALADGRAGAALALASALLAFDATDERATRLALEASHRLGDRDSARQAFARLDKALRSEVGVVPAEETSALYQRVMTEAAPVIVPAAPAVVAAPVAVPGPVPGAPGVTRMPPATLPPPAPLPPARSRRWLRWAGAGIAVAVLVAGASLWRRGAGETHRVIFVQPLHVDDGDDAARTLRSGLAADLARLIVGHDATLAVTDVDGPTAAAGEPDFVLSGEAQGGAGQLHADIKLRGRRDAAILWSRSFTRPAAELEGLREQMSAKIADVTVCALGGHHPAPDQLDLETMRLYLGACEQKHDDWQESVRLLRKVVARNPGFAHAWAMLAAATATVADGLPKAEAEPAYREAEGYARRALALDPKDGEAVYALAVTQPGIAHLLARIALLEAGHRDDPDNGVVTGTLAWNLALAGRTREATLAARQALETDPFSSGELTSFAELRAFGGALDEAEDLLEIGRRRFPQAEGVAGAEFRIAALVGDPRRAGALLAAHPGKFVQDPAPWQAMIAARAKPSPAAEEAAVGAILAATRRHPQIGLRTLQRLAAVDRLDAAQAFAAQSPVVDADNEDQDVLFSDLLGPLRADPRFMTLAARQGLVAIWSASNRWPDFCEDKALPYDCKAGAAKALSRAVPK